MIRGSSTPLVKKASPPSSDTVAALGGPTGTLLAAAPEWPGWTASLVMSALLVGVIELLAAQAPVPPGGDSGTWTALSYPYILYPHPSQIVAFGYPPLLFPLLGFLVQIGGGPLVGARLFMGLVGFLLGSSTYVLGRSLFRRRVSALLAQGFLFVTTPFLRLFFFGGYPTLLAMVFMNLALAFGLRYLRARRPAYIAIFWLATGAALLTHEFVGLALTVTLAIFGFFLLLRRRLPAAVAFSRAGVASMAVAVAGVAAFYLGSRLAKIPQNNYLAQSAAAHLRFPLSPVLYPLHIQSLGGVLGFHLIKTPEGSFLIAVGLVLLLFVGLLAVAWRRPRWLTLSVLVVASSILAVLVMAVGGWTLFIFTDYKRFAYSLYLPFLLAGLLAFDTVFHWCSPVASPGPASVSVRRGRPGLHASARGTLPRPRSRAPPGSSLTNVIAVAGAAILLSSGSLIVYPGLVAYEAKYSGPSHSQAYLDALNAILRSNLAGNILSTSAGAAGHWTIALTDRNVYAPAIPSGFVFKTGKIRGDQLAFFTLHDRYVVSNGLTFAAIPGNSSLFFAASPAYGALRIGYPTPIIGVTPEALQVTFVNGTTVHAYNPGALVPTVQVVNASNPELIVAYGGPGFTLAVTTTELPGTDAQINVSAHATGAVNLRALTAGLRPAPGISTSPRVTQNGSSFTWSPRISGYQSMLTYGSAAPPAQVLVTGASASSPLGSSVKLDLSSPSLVTGSAWLNLSLHLSTPGAIDLASPLPRVILAPQVLAYWNVRFVLVSNITRASQLSEILYLQTEYGATELFKGGIWEVLLLPQTIVGARS